MTLQATNDDIIFLGHGSYPGGMDNIVLPAGLDLHILGPVGAQLEVAAAKLLVDKKIITQLRLTAGGRESDLMPHFPHIYRGGEQAPNLRLYPLDEMTRNFLMRNNVLMTVMVQKETPLADLVTLDEVARKAANAAKAGKSVRVFWVACADQRDGSVISAVGLN